MIQSVNSVLVGKSLPSTYTTLDALTAGDVALFDQNQTLIKTAADAAKATALYIGVAKAKVAVTMPDGSIAQKANIEFSNKITKDLKLTYTQSSYVAPTQESLSIAFATVTPVVDQRYVLRIVYKDIYEAPGQFTHSYEVFAKTTAAADLAAAFAKAINKHAGRRVSATATTTTLAITALEKDDNEGINSLSEYSIVSMDATVYTTDNSSLANYPKSVAGVAITKTQGNPGKGYWKQVRDLEVRNMGYKGHVFTGAYPAVEQTLNVELGETYDNITIASENRYLSADNQYIKNTPVCAILYVKHATGFATSVAVKGIEAFISGVAPSA